MTKATTGNKATATKKPVPVTKAVILRVQDFADNYKIKKSVVGKLIEEANIQVMFSQPSGRGFINLYSVEAVEPLLKKYLEDQAAAEIERKKAEDAKNARKQSKAQAKQQELPLQQIATLVDPTLLDPLKEQIRSFGEKIARNQEVSDNQYQVLNTGIKMLEQRMDGMHKTLASLELLLTDYLTTPTNPLTPATTTTDAVPVQATQEEANKGQEFFPQSTSVPKVDPIQVSTKTLSLSKKSKEASAGTGKVKGGEGSEQESTQKAEGGKQLPVGKEGTRTKGAKPRVLVIGLHDNNVRHFNDFMNEMDLTIINPDNAKSLSTKTFPQADYTLFMVGNIGHAGCDHAAPGSKEIKVTGGNTRLRHQLAMILEQHQAA